MLTQRETALLTRHMITVDNTFRKLDPAHGTAGQAILLPVETELPGIINAGGGSATTSTARRSRPAATAGTGRRPKSDPGRAVPLPGIHHRGHTGRYALFGHTCCPTVSRSRRLPLRHSEQPAELGEPDPEAARTFFTQAVCFGQDARWPKRSAAYSGGGSPTWSKTDRG